MLEKLFTVLRLLSAILKGLFITVSISIILLILIICSLFIRIESKSYYRLESYHFMEDRKLDGIEDIYFTSGSNIFIELDNPNNTLYLDRILIIYNRKNIGGISVNKVIKNSNGKKNIFMYSLEKDLIKIFGKRNEKYDISEYPFMEKGFMFEVIIIDSHTKKEYRYKNEVLISFVEKGVRLWIPSR